MGDCRSEFLKWADGHAYLPITERDFFAVWVAAWNACLNKVDAEMEGNEFSNASRDLIQDQCKP